MTFFKKSLTINIQYISFILHVLLVANIAGEKTPRIAFVLSGGGARGLAQIGVLKALEEASIKPDVIVATSIGAIIGSLYAVGLTTDEIIELAKKFDWDNMFNDMTQRKNLLVSQKTEPVNYLFELRFNTNLTPIIPNSISQGQNIYSLLLPITTAPLYQAGMDFDSLSIPLRLVATNIITGKKIVFSKGNLPKIVRASCGFPLAFSPVSIDSMLLLDGGLSENIPVETARNEGADYIVAIDVTSPMWKKEDLNNPLHIMDQIVGINIEKQKATQRNLAHRIIKPHLEGIRNTDYSTIDTLINKGYVAAKEAISQIQEDLYLLANSDTIGTNNSFIGSQHPYFFHIIKDRDNSINTLESSIHKLKKKNYPYDSVSLFISEIFTRLSLPFAKANYIRLPDSSVQIVINPGLVTDILVHGTIFTSKRLIVTTSGIQKGSIITNNGITQAISRLYATNLFHTVSMVFDEQNRIVIHLKEKEFWRARFGLRFDEFHMVEGYVQPAYENLFGSGISASFHLQYGPIREKYAFDLMLQKPFSRIWTTSMCFQSYVSREKIIHRFRKNEPDILPDSSIVFPIVYNEMDLRKSGISFEAGTQLGRSTMFDGSLRFERFEVSKTSQSAFKDPLGTRYRDGIIYLSGKLIIDDLDRFPYPTFGQRHLISISGAANTIYGTENFLHIQTSLSYFFTIKKKHTFSQKFISAWADQDLPPVEQIYIGGVFPNEKYQDIGVFNHVPFIGLGPRAISGDIMALLHSTYRFILFKNIYVSTILDWGYAWHYQKTAKELEFAFNKSTFLEFVTNAPLGFGLGLSYNTIIGPINLVWGTILSNKNTLKNKFNIINIKKNVIYFSIGHDF